MKRLTRSSNDKYILGVCGGLADYLNIDSTIIRIIWFVLMMSSLGIFGLAYLICGFVIPLDNNIEDHKSYENNNSKIFIGISLIVIGLYMVSNLLFPHLSATIYRLIRFWPSLLVLLGLYVIFKKN